MKLHEQISRIPFLRTLVPLILGVLAADAVNISAVALVCAAAVLAAGLILLRKNRIIVAALIFAIGMAAAKINHISEKIPRNTRVTLSCTITDNVMATGRWQRTTATANAWKIYGDSAAVWQPCDEGLQIYVDTTVKVGIGDMIGCTGYVTPLDTADISSSYSRTMRSRGIVGKMYVIAGRIAVIGNDRKGGIVRMAKAVNRRLVERINRLDCNTKETAVGNALLTGERRLLDKTTKEEYSRSGTSHVLSISGLHLGIIFLVINYAFMPLIFVRHGRAIRSVLVIAALWAYAFISGLSAPVLRAAFMLGVLQFSAMSVRKYNSYNALFGSAFVLMLINPYYIHDISFQLSYMALLSILFFQKRISRWTGVTRATNYMKYKEIDVQGFEYYTRLAARGVFTFVTGTTILGISAQIGVMPLVGHVFGRLPLASVMMNPPVMVVVTLLMTAGFIYVVTAWNFSGVVFAYLLGVQNDLVKWTSRMRFTSMEGVNISDEALYVSYILMFAAAFIIKRAEDIYNDKYRV